MICLHKNNAPWEVVTYDGIKFCMKNTSLLNDSTCSMYRFFTFAS